MIQGQKIEIMSGVIYLVPRYFFKEVIMRSTHDLLLVVHFLERGVEAQNKFTHTYRHLKRFKGEDERHVKEFLESNFTTPHISPIASKFIV